MEKVKLTCPLTGVEFDALINEPELVPLARVYVNHPLEHYPMDLYINEHWELCIPIKSLQHIETIEPADVADVLDVSRQRVYQILADDVIPSHMVNGKTVFKLDDVMRYADTRTPGRPKKED